VRSRRVSPVAAASHSACSVRVAPLPARSRRRRGAMTAESEDLTPTTDHDAGARLAADVQVAHEHVQRLEEEYAALLADSGVIQEDRDAVRLLLESARSVAAAAERAVQRYEAGDYGRCVQCGNPIGA